MKAERQTRQEKIDLQLGRAGWAVGSKCLVEEFLVQAESVTREHAQGNYQIANEFADYALLDSLGRVVAIVEAKRSSRDPLTRTFMARTHSLSVHAFFGQLTVGWREAHATNIAAEDTECDAAFKVRGVVTVKRFGLVSKSPSVLRGAQRVRPATSTGTESIREVKL